jgi:hypothetical protein
MVGWAGTATAEMMIHKRTILQFLRQPLLFPDGFIKSGNSRVSSTGLAVGLAPSYELKPRRQSNFMRIQQFGCIFE